MYIVTVKFDTGEKVECIRDTFSKAKWWANYFVRDGSFFCDGVVTEYSIKELKSKDKGGDKE